MTGAETSEGGRSRRNVLQLAIANLVVVLLGVWLAAWLRGVSVGLSVAVVIAVLAFSLWSSRKLRRRHDVADPADG